jgi:hypothetical protein
MKFTAFGTLAIALSLNLGLPRAALAWGDEGHQVVGLIAQAFLETDVRKKVLALLAAGTDNLTAHDVASAATWADKFRDSNSGGSRTKTRQWHFADIETSGPNLAQACFNFPKLPAGTLASHGPADDCVVDKIQEFAAELSVSAIDLEEQIVALKFLLHFVGDLHQPLHDSDDNDRGGNAKRVSAASLKAGNLHHYWDTEFVDQLGSDAKNIASDLIGHITSQQEEQWKGGTVSDWAMESFQVAKKDAYGQLPEPNSRGSFRLSDDYVTTATNVVAAQLSKAGVHSEQLTPQAVSQVAAGARLRRPVVANT